MDYRHKQLRQELAALTTAFGQLGAYLTDVAKEVASPGVNPSEKVIEQIQASRKQFDAVRCSVHALATEMLVNPLPRALDVVSIEKIDSLLVQAAAAEENRSFVEAEREKALAVMARVLRLSHADGKEFKPLADCLTAAGVLRTSIENARWPQRHPDSEGIVAEKHSLNALLKMVEKRDLLDDDESVTLEEQVTQAYGKQLSVAALRGKLQLAAGAPAPAKVVESKPAEAKAPAPDVKPPDVKAAEPKVQEAKAPDAKPATEAKQTELKTPEVKAPEAKVSETKPESKPVDVKPVETKAPEAPKPAPVAAEAPKASPARPAVQPPAPAPVAAKPVPAAPKHVAAEVPKPAPVETPAPAVEAPKPVAAPVADAPKTVPAPIPAPAVEPARPAAQAAPAVETPRPVAAPVPVPVPEAARPVAVPAAAAEKKETGAPSVAALSSAVGVQTVAPTPAPVPVPVGAPSGAELPDRRAKEPRLATPNAPALTAKVEVKDHVEALLDGKKEPGSEAGGQRPQRWGFWRGNR